jgi:hypothetical protein
MCRKPFPAKSIPVEIPRPLPSVLLSCSAWAVNSFNRVFVLTSSTRFRADSASVPQYVLTMSFSEVLACLPKLTLVERQTLIRRALELDDPGLSVEDEALVEKRLADHRQNPASMVSAEAMKERVRSRVGK